MKHNRVTYLMIAVVVLYFALPIVPLVPLAVVCNVVKSKRFFNAVGIFFWPVDYLSRKGPNWLNGYYNAQGRLAEKVITIDRSYL